MNYTTLKIIRKAYLYIPVVFRSVACTRSENLTFLFSAGFHKPLNYVFNQVSPVL